MTKIEMVNKMVENGYVLINETVEHFANRFDEETIERFLKNFLDWQELEKTLDE